MLHRLMHLLKLEPCMNFTEWRNNELWHYVICIKCGKRVLEFDSGVRRNG